MPGGRRSGSSTARTFSPSCRRSSRGEAKIDREKEHFRIVGLDADECILFIELVALGGVTSGTVKLMEVFRVAVLKNAVSAILVHNQFYGWG